jgi:undecaprenyl pyrophosphate synthase
MKGLIEMTPTEIKRSYQQLAQGIENFIKYNEGADEAMTLTLEATRAEIEAKRLSVKNFEYTRIWGSTQEVTDRLKDAAVEREDEKSKYRQYSMEFTLAKCNQIIEELQELENE